MEAGLDLQSDPAVLSNEGANPKEQGYQSIAKYHKDIDAVVIQFTNTTNFDGYNWNLSEIIYSRIVKILKRQKRS